MDTSQTPSEPPETRPDYWQRILRKGAGKNPTVVVRLAIRDAARWSAEAVRVMSDPTISVDNKIRAASMARRSRADLAIMIGAGREKPKAGPNALAEYVASKQRVSA